MTKLASEAAEDAGTARIMRRVRKALRQGRETLIPAEVSDASIQETRHLVRSAANARRLCDAMAAADAGKLTEFDPNHRGRPLDLLRKAWTKASPEERRAFLHDMLDNTDPVTLEIRT